MIDISHKRSTLRYAKASGKLFAEASIIDFIREKKVPKGDVGEIARSAGIQAAKRTSDWIVFCHSLPLDWVEITMELEENAVSFIAEVRTVWKTGVEMEAMTAVNAALLNAYDMLKPLQADISLGDIRLEEKRGGKADMKDHFDDPVRTALISVDSDKENSRSAGFIRRFLADYPVDIVAELHLGADREPVKEQLEHFADQGRAELVFICGSTGPNPDDIMPELISEVSERELPGIGDMMRSYGFERTPHAMISRQIAGIRKKTLFIALPGSSRGAEESMNALFPGLLHIFKVIRRSSG